MWKAKSFWYFRVVDISRCSTYENCVKSLCYLQNDGRLLMDIANWMLMCSYFTRCWEFLTKIILVCILTNALLSTPKNIRFVFDIIFPFFLWECCLLTSVVPSLVAPLRPCLLVYDIVNGNRILMCMFFFLSSRHCLI